MASLVSCGFDVVIHVSFLDKDMSNTLLLSAWGDAPETTISLPVRAANLSVQNPLAIIKAEFSFQNSDSFLLPSVAGGVTICYLCHQFLFRFFFLILPRHLIFSAS